ncbi:hypothetical protein SLEP1_g14175 [Rubroshorea leprosula]|uniref:Uncharacterized protein n=1 Tax=Rubroshorea leprosula TaxID=152421 RepID=A0AAV5ITQ0_9ROSI|nr:hypothetical protein SLEP1_g14175 [Rubroshorea leprosula]
MMCRAICSSHVRMRSGNTVLVFCTRLAACYRSFSFVFSRRQ